MVFGRKASFMRHPSDHDKNADADHHMKRVHSRKREVQREENLAALVNFRTAFPKFLRIVGNFIQSQQLLVAFSYIAFATDCVVVKSWYVVLDVFVAPLFALDPQKDQAEKECRKQQLNLSFRVTELGSANSL